MIFHYHCYCTNISSSLCLDFLKLSCFLLLLSLVGLLPLLVHFCIHYIWLLVITSQSVSGCPTVLFWSFLATFGGVFHFLPSLFFQPILDTDISIWRAILLVTTLWQSAPGDMSGVVDLYCPALPSRWVSISSYFFLLLLHLFFHDVPWSC